MEFNVLPKSKFLSLSPRNNHRSSQTTNQTVNVILPRESKVEQSQQLPEESKVEQDGEIIEQSQQLPEESSIHYTNREVKLNEPAEHLNNEDSISTINFLKLVLKAHLDNPVKLNSIVICSVPVLENIIETLTGCDDCSVEYGDVEVKCCKNINNIVPISKIWVQTNGNNEVFKYKYSNYLQLFEEYKISLKFVQIE